MKTSNRALLVASFASALAVSGCGRQKSYFTIDGIIKPPDQCTFAYGKSSTFIGNGELYLSVQKDQGFTPRYVLGLNVSNNLTTVVDNNAAGNPIEVSEKNDIIVEEIDVDFAGDPGATAIPSQVIKLNATVPAGSGAAVPVNILASTGATAVSKISKNTHYYLTLTVKGSTQSGSSVSSDPFIFGLDVNTSVTSDEIRTAGKCAVDAALIYSGCGPQDALPTCEAATGP